MGRLRGSAASTRKPDLDNANVGKTGIQARFPLAKMQARRAF